MSFIYTFIKLQILYVEFLTETTFTPRISNCSNLVPDFKFNECNLCRTLKDFYDLSRNTNLVDDQEISNQNSL